VREPFWSPGLYAVHECPDLFRMSGRWYLVFSTTSDRCVTHYRVSNSLEGPWSAPVDDALDGRAFYAAKTCSDGERRLAIGWISTREGESDSGPWQWGGAIAAHEIVAADDGSLCSRMPPGIAAHFGRNETGQLSPVSGAWEIAAGAAAESAGARAGGTHAVALGSLLPDTGLITARVRFAEGTRGCGIVLRCDDEGEAGYFVRLEPGRNRLVLDSWPRMPDRPFFAELERPLRMAPGEPVELSVVFDGTAAIAYAGGRAAMSFRMYGRRAGRWGLFVTEGEARFEQPRLLAAQETAGARNGVK